MREKTIEQKFRKAVRDAGGVALKFTSPDLTGYPTGWHFSPAGGWRLWRSRLPAKSPARSNWQDTGCCGGWVLKCMCWMMWNRSEG